MKKVFSSAVFIFLAIHLKAQIGIATDSPRATLDVTGKPTAATIADGIIAPRISLANLNAKSAYGANQIGAIIYINNITGTAAGATANINAIGYYYFDGGKWVKFAGDSTNIYNSNGSLTSPRTVTQGANTLAFSGTVANAFSVAGNTFSVDALNNRVGIGTTTPTRKLNVVGTGLFNAAPTWADTTDALEINIGKDGQSYGNRKENFGIHIKSDVSVQPGSIARINFGDIGLTGITKSKYLSFSVGNTLNELMYLTDSNNGRVGIGTTAPTNTLHVKATADPVKLEGLQADATAPNIVVADAAGVLKTIDKASISSNIYNTNGSLTSPRTVTQGANTLAFTSTATNGFSVAGTTISVDGANNRVGMGTTAPTNALHVKAASNPVKLEGLQADATAPNIVVADAAGVLKTIDKASISSNIYNTNGSLTDNRTVTQGANTLAFTGTAANAFSIDGSTFSVDAANDRVGIGTTAPTRKLHVEGPAFINPVRTWSETTDALEINIGKDGNSYGNRKENFGIHIKSQVSIQPGSIARINFGDTSTTSVEKTKYLSFSVGNTLNELMYLTDSNNGRVGIGTTNPTAMLDVNGDIATSGKVYSASSTYADYVFEKYFTGKSEINNKYNFTLLKDVKSFVEKNHHLPGVTPITDLKKEGNGYKFDMSSLAIQQLEKLEELYLHVIEQQEQLEAKETKIKTLEVKMHDLESRLEKLENQSAR